MLLGMQGETITIHAEEIARFQPSGLTLLRSSTSHTRHSSPALPPCPPGDRGGRPLPRSRAAGVAKAEDVPGGRGGGHKCAQKTEEEEGGAWVGLLSMWKHVPQPSRDIGEGFLDPTWICMHERKEICDSSFYPCTCEI